MDNHRVFFLKNVVMVQLCQQFMMKQMVTDRLQAIMNRDAATGKD